jgi:hypothetical protein
VVKAPHAGANHRFNRSYEYDGLSDNYARFLIEELFPFIEQKYGLKLSKNPNDGSIGGASSGAIAAFTAAWERPDRFRRVFERQNLQAQAEHARREFIPGANQTAAAAAVIDCCSVSGFGL